MGVMIKNSATTQAKQKKAKKPMKKVQKKNGKL